MSNVHDQALIHAPLTTIWELIGDPRRYPEWWPRVVSVRGEEFEQGSEFVQVTRDPGRNVETVMSLDKLEDMRRVQLHCTLTGTYTHWLLTEAQGNTFVDVEFGMEPIRLRDHILDKTVATPYFRRWLSDTLDGLEKAACAQPSANL